MVREQLDSPCSPSRLSEHMIRVQLFSVGVALILTGGASQLATAAETIEASPELRFSLHDAIQATIDNSVNVR